jgi:hypothetical protein
MKEGYEARRKGHHLPTLKLRENRGDLVRRLPFLDAQANPYRSQWNQLLSEGGGFVNEGVDLPSGEIAPFRHTG